MLAGDGSVLLCDKPAGITSHDLVQRVRRERGCKAGHAGTLDPFATGLMLVLLGRATRLQRFLTGLPSKFEPATGNPRLNGVIVDADDATGKAIGVTRISYSERELLAFASTP